MDDTAYDSGEGVHDAYVYDPGSGTVQDVPVGPDTVDAGNDVLVYNSDTGSYDDSGQNYHGFDSGAPYDAGAYDGVGYDGVGYDTGGYDAGGAEPVDTGDITSVL